MRNLTRTYLGRLRRYCGAVYATRRAALDTLSGKFLVRIISVLIISVIAVVGAKEWVAYTDASDRMAERLQVLAASQSLILAEAVARKDKMAATMIVAAIISDPAVSGLILTDSDGKVLDLYGRHDPAPDALTVRQGINWIGENGPVRVGEVVVVGNTRAVFQGLKQSLYIEAVAALLLVAVAVVVSHLTYKRTINEPLRRLLVAIRSIDDNITPASVEWATRDEMGRVVTAFNDLRGKQNEAQSRLRSVMSALVEANGSLDRRVVERTKILEEEIQERKQAETEMRRARDEARNANQAKTQFLSSMSHELRTPLNAILGFSQLLETDELDPLNSAQAENINEVMKAGRHLLELIEEVLDLARIEAGSMNLQTEPTDIATVVAECLSLVSTQARDRRVTLPKQASGPALPWIMADRRRVKQVLINLLTNSIKYNEINGRVGIDFEVLPSGYLRVSISDTGVGIASDQLGVVFDPFFRSASVSRTVDGVGIGLAIAKQLVESMGGSIALKSSLGVGSTFWIELPIAENRDVAVGATG